MLLLNKIKNLMLYGMYIILICGMSAVLTGCKSGNFMGTTNSPFIKSSGKPNFKQRYQPIYNQRHIIQAKKNILSNADEYYSREHYPHNSSSYYAETEEYNPARVNRRTYQNFIARERAQLAQKMELEDNANKPGASRVFQDKIRYKDLNTINTKPISTSGEYDNRNEIKKLQSELNKLKEDNKNLEKLAKMRCMPQAQNAVEAPIMRKTSPQKISVVQPYISAPVINHSSGNTPAPKPHAGNSGKLNSFTTKPMQATKTLSIPPTKTLSVEETKSIAPKPADDSSNSVNDQGNASPAPSMPMPIKNAVPKLEIKKIHNKRSKVKKIL